MTAASTSTMVYAMAIWKTKPKIPPTLAVRTIALGVATCALEHSSAKWKGESNPDMVQMTAMKDIKMQIPSGQSVKLSSPQAILLELNFGRPCSFLLLPPKMTIQEMKRKTRLRMVEQVLIQAIHFVGAEAMMAAKNVKPTVSK